MLDRLAAVLSEVLAPVVLAYLVCLVVAVGGTNSLLRGVVVGLTVATLTAGVPFALVLWASRQGRVSGRHVSDLKQRPVVLLLAASSTLVAVPASRWVGGTRDVQALVVAVLAGLLIAAAVSTFWKVSIHVAAAAGATAALAAVLGPALLLLGVVVAGLAWARVRLDAHDVPQVVAGAVIGAVVTTSVMGALR